MNYIWTLLLGAIQGLTECLPISSQAHVLFVRHLLLEDSTTAFSENVLLHLGSGLAVMLLCLGETRKLTVSFIAIVSDFFENLKISLGMGSRRSQHHKVLSTDARCLAWIIFVSSLVAGIVGLLLRPFAVTAADNMLAPGIGLFMTALFLLVSLQIPPINKPLKNCKLLEAVLIGLLEGCAVFPGVSRFAVVLAACSIIGVSRKNQYRLALYSILPVVFGGCISEIITIFINKTTFSPVILLGSVAAFITTLIFGNAELSIVRSFQSRKFFVAWCFLAGTVCTITYFLF